MSEMLTLNCFNCRAVVAQGVIRYAHPFCDITCSGLWYEKNHKVHKPEYYEMASDNSFVKFLCSVDTCNMVGYAKSQWIEWEDDDE